MARQITPLSIVLLLYGLTATAYAWLNPVFEAPDEPFHVGYVNRLLQDRHWPQASDAYTMTTFLAEQVHQPQVSRVLNAGQGEIWFEWVHPPLYYLVQVIPLGLLYPKGFQGVLVPAWPDAPNRRERGYFIHDPAEIWRWHRPLVAIRLMRMTSILLGIVTIWIAASIAALVAPRASAFPLLAAGLLAFIPQFTFMTSSVNNDAAGDLTGAVGLWVLIRVGEGTWRPVRAGLFIGLCLGAAFLSKATTNFLWLLTPVAAGMAYSRWIDRLQCVSVAWTVGLLCAAPFLHSLGPAYWDALGFLASGRSNFATSVAPSTFLGQPPGVDLSYVVRVLTTMFESFWGQFGWEQVRLDRPILGCYAALSGLALLGWCRGRQGHKEGVLNRRALALLGAGLALFLCCAAVIYRRIFIAQGGRYLLAVGPAIVTLLAVGLLRAQPLIARALCRPVSEQALVRGVLTLMVILNWVVLWSLRHSYLVAWQNG